MDRVELGVPAGEKGVLVESVSEGGWAALAHLGDGDVILAVQGEVVGDVAALQKRMEAIATSPTTSPCTARITSPSPRCASAAHPPSLTDSDEHALSPARTPSSTRSVSATSRTRNSKFGSSDYS